MPVKWWDAGGCYELNILRSNLKGKSYISSIICIVLYPLFASCNITITHNADYLFYIFFFDFFSQYFIEVAEQEKEIKNKEDLWRIFNGKRIIINFHFTYTFYDENIIYVESLNNVWVREASLNATKLESFKEKLKNYKEVLRCFCWSVQKLTPQTQGS